MKDILKNLKLKSSGNKQELIERILINQRTYFELLPKDVLGIVDRYQIENNKNNQLLVYFLNLIKWKIIGTKDPNIRKDIEKYLGTITERDFDSYFINEFLKNNNLDIELVEEEDEDDYGEGEDIWRLINIKIGKLPLITDKLMANILLTLLHSSGNSVRLIYAINRFFYDNQTPFILANVGVTGRPHIIVMYGGNIIEEK